MANASSAGRKECNVAGEPGSQRYNTGCHNTAGADGTIEPELGRNADGLPGGLHEPGGYQNSGGVLGAFEEIFTAVLNEILWPAGYGAEQHPWEPPRVATGVKNRTNRLKALGNSIVWAQIFPILLAIKLITEGVRQNA